ncbi:MAG: hypothetical protein KIT27_08715 [Legionellales bacterium]|nr:hypothetical protein [Legionellales bacterium]
MKKIVILSVLFVGLFFSSAFASQLVCDSAGNCQCPQTYNASSNPLIGTSIFVNEDVTQQLPSVLTCIYKDDTSFSVDASVPLPWIANSPNYYSEKIGATSVCHGGEDTKDAATIAERCSAHVFHLQHSP